MQGAVVGACLSGGGHRYGHGAGTLYSRHRGPHGPTRPDHCPTCKTVIFWVSNRPAGLPFEGPGHPPDGQIPPLFGVFTPPGGCTSSPLAPPTSIPIAPQGRKTAILVISGKWLKNHPVLGRNLPKWPKMAVFDGFFGQKWRFWPKTLCNDPLAGRDMPELTLWDL